jgi:hypothetical protein
MAVHLWVARSKYIYITRKKRQALNDEDTTENKGDRIYLILLQDEKS